MTTNMLNVIIEPEDIANLTVYLACDKSRYITAQAMNISAGRCFW